MNVRIRSALAVAVLALAVAVLALTTAQPAAAQSPEADPLLGAWHLERDTPRGPMTIPFEFVQQGDSIVVFAGQGENATSMGRVEQDGTKVSFTLDLRALMQRAMAGRGEGRRAGAGAGVGRGGRAGGARGGGGAMEPPVFTGTLEGAALTGTLATPRGDQSFVLRRVEGG